MTLIGTVQNVDWRELARRVREEVGTAAIFVDAIASMEERDLSRFVSKLRADGDCLVWTGWRDPEEYGQFALRRNVRFRAHRFAWALANCRLPDGLVLHACDNPPCCNPAHLSVGTQKDNIRDMDSKGRRGVSYGRPNASGERHHNAKLTDEQVRELRALWRSGVATASLAATFGIRRTTANAIARGMQRKSVA